MTIDEHPKIPGTERVTIYYSHAGKRWFVDCKTIRNDEVEFDIAGPGDEATHKAVIGILRAIVLSMNALGAAIDDQNCEQAER